MTTARLRANRLRFLSRPRGAGRVGASAPRSGVETRRRGAQAVVLGAETPKMPLGVAAGIKAAAQTVFLGLELDFRAGRLGAFAMQLGIGDRQIEHVRVAAAHRARLDHEIIKHRVGDGAHEHAAVTQPQQDVFDVVVGLLGTLVLPEAEGVAQPARRGAGISIPQDRRHRRYVLPRRGQRRLRARAHCPKGTGSIKSCPHSC